MRKRYQKLTVLALVIILLLGLTGCREKEVVTIKVGVAIYRFDDNFMSLYRYELEQYFISLNNEDYNYALTIVDSQFDQNLQDQQIDDFISQRFDVLIVNMVKKNATADIVAKCKAANIPVVFINREPEDPEDLNIWSGEETYVGSDARDSGVYQGEIILDLPNHGDLNNNGSLDYIMLIGDPNNTDAQFRTEYSIGVIKNAGIKVNKLGEKVCNWQSDEAEKAMADFLNKFSKHEIDVIFCNNDSMAIGALTALKAAGYEVGKNVYLVGVDAIPEAIAAIENDEMTGTVLNDHVGQAHKAADVAIALLNGEEVVPYYWVNYKKITK